VDLGIKGRTAFVCGGSSGLGKAIATQLAREGVHVTIVARTESSLRSAADDISQTTDQTVNIVSCDLADDGQRQVLASRLGDADILVNNSGGPPVGNYLEFTNEQWLTALQSNMLSAIELINSVLPGMCERQFGRILNVTSHMVKAPLAILSLSNGARAGLTGYVGGVSRDVAHRNVTINNIMPGQFATPRLQSNHERIAKAQNMSLEAFTQKSKQDIPAGRFGKPDEFGAYAAFLCSDHAGFITGQNLMLDGGQYPGLF